MGKELYKKQLSEVIKKMIADGADPDQIFLALTEISLEYLESLRMEDQSAA